MVAQTISLPNIRRFFIPDIGQTIVSADLAGADAQVVAWEAEDEGLKEAFRRGLKLHIKNAREMFPVKTRGMTDEALKTTDRPGGIYFNNKRAVHATNYGAAARTLARKLGWLVHESEMWQRKWYGLHPGIKRWQERVQGWLDGTEPQWISGRPEPRTIYNRFGYRIVYFDRIEGLLPHALAWIPQSTVAINCSRGALQLEERLSWTELLLQVHDELVFQFPSRFENRTKEVLDALRVEVPYPDPLVIQWNIGMSRKSWGDAKG